MNNLLSVMCSYCSHVQKGMGMEDIGPLINNRRIFQRGGGSILTPSRYYFYYSPYTHRGRGIGSVFLKFFKAVSPMFVKGLKSVGKEALLAGSDILANTSGAPMKELVRSRSKKAFENLKRKAGEKIEQVMAGSGKRAIKRRRTQKYNQSLLAIKPVHKDKTVKKSKNKKKIKDIFN